MLKREEMTPLESELWEDMERFERAWAKVRRTQGNSLWRQKGHYNKPQDELVTCLKRPIKIVDLAVHGLLSWEFIMLRPKYVSLISEANRAEAWRRLCAAKLAAITEDKEAA